LIVNKLDSIWKSLFDVSIIDITVACTLRAGRAIIGMGIILNWSSFIGLSTLNCTPGCRRSLLGPPLNQRNSSVCSNIASISHQLLEFLATIFSDLDLLLAAREIPGRKKLLRRDLVVAPWCNKLLLGLLLGMDYISKICNLHL